jgi:hypothetical protein
MTAYFAFDCLTFSTAQTNACVVPQLPQCARKERTKSQTAPAAVATLAPGAPTAVVVTGQQGVQQQLNHLQQLMDRQWHVAVA